MRQTLALVVALVALSGCTTMERTFMATDLAKVSIGDSKATVVAALGGVATPVAVATEDGHVVEILEFVEKPVFYGRANDAFWSRYWTYFVDGQLVSYEKAYDADALAHEQWVDETLAQAATMDAVKGTALAPYKVDVDIE